MTETCGTEGTNPNWPDCPDDDVEPEGTACEDPLSGAYGECLGDAAACPLLNCKYTIDCPNGYECMLSPPGGIARGACLPETDGSFGSSCTGTSSPGQGTCNSGLNCCRGMRFDGEGVAAGDGQSGRCMECCLTDALDETVVGCGGPPFQCCDGSCIDPDSSTRHCGACAYNSAGRDCSELVSACNPSTECDLGACKYDEPCYPEACIMPTGDPDCTDLTCYARPIDECFDGPSYTGCDWSCGGTIAGACLHEPCIDDADCCTGTVCTSSCNPLTNPYCVDPLTCEPAE